MEGGRWGGRVERVTLALRSTDHANKVTYGHSRVWLPVDDQVGRAGPGGSTETRPPPAMRTVQSMYHEAVMYERLRDANPQQAAEHYKLHGQGIRTPLFMLPYKWMAVPDAMHAVFNFTYQ